MLGTVPMMRVRALVLAYHERVVLEDLGRLGAIHLTGTQPEFHGVPLSSVDYTDALAGYDHLRNRVQELRQVLGISPSSKESIPAEMTSAQAQQSLGSMEQRTEDLLGRRRRLTERRKELTSLREKTAAYRGLEIPLNGTDQYSFLHFVTGSVPAQNLKDLAKTVGDTAALLPLAQRKEQQSLFAVTTSRGRPLLERALQQAGFQEDTLPVVEGATVDSLSVDLEKEQDLTAKELEHVNEEIRATAADFTRPLATIERFSYRECRLLEASRKFLRTEATVLIEGWVPANDTGTLEKRLGEITENRYVLEATTPDPSTDEHIPVLLRHSRLLRPFEMLVSSYGLPSYRELEPTLFVALSYVVMFGMMFGDAGHGMILAMCGLIALLAGKSRKTRDFGVLLLFGGLGSVVFGVIYGSFFGIEEFKKYALWHDPLEGDPIRLMYGAIGLGIAIISLGLVLNIINRFRKGDVIGGILDKFGLVGLLFYWGSLVLLLIGPAVQSRGLMGEAVILFLIVPIVGWCLKEPIEHVLRQGTGAGNEEGGGLPGAIMESCVGAFEAILSYLANTISFVRLAAYAMSHAALLLAAFMVAAEVRDVSFGGSLWSLLIIILGNIVAIVLEGIIASVQALRLEYYEFFGKFFSGAGQPFEPFRLAREDMGSMGK